MKPLVTPKEAVEVLNRALASDKEAMQRFLGLRVMCNTELADDPTIQVKKESEDSYSVGLIGIINGIFGVKENGYGYIAGVFDLECPAGKLEDHLTEEEAKDLTEGDTCPKCETEIIVGPVTRFMELP